MTKLEARINKPFEATFEEGPCNVKCEAKGVGPATLAKWERIVRVALKALEEENAYWQQVQEAGGARSRWMPGVVINRP